MAMTHEHPVRHYFNTMFQKLLGYSAPHVYGSQSISPVLGTFIFVYGG